MADRLKFTEGGKEILHPPDCRVEIDRRGDEILIRYRFYDEVSALELITCEHSWELDVWVPTHQASEMGAKLVKLAAEVGNKPAEPRAFAIEDLFVEIDPDHIKVKLPSAPGKSGTVRFWMKTMGPNRGDVHVYKGRCRFLICDNGRIIAFNPQVKVSFELPLSMTQHLEYAIDKALRPETKEGANAEE